MYPYKGKLKSNARHISVTVWIFRKFTHWGNLAATKWRKRPEEWLKPCHMDTHLRVLSESYSMNINIAGLRWFSKKLCILELWRVKGLACQNDTNAFHQLQLCSAAKSKHPLLTRMLITRNVTSRSRSTASAWFLGGRGGGTVSKWYQCILPATALNPALYGIHKIKTSIIVIFKACSQSINILLHLSPAVSHTLLVNGHHQNHIHYQSW